MPIRKVKIWVAQSHDKRELRMMRSLKGLCVVIGMKYSTAVKTQPVDGVKKVWIIKGVVWDVWVNYVER